MENLGKVERRREITEMIAELAARLDMARVLKTGGGMQGTVKFFDTTKRFGFINVDGDGEDVFVHASAVDGGELRPGERLAFGVIQADRGPKAVNVERLEDGGESE